MLKVAFKPGLYSAPSTLPLTSVPVWTLPEGSTRARVCTSPIELAHGQYLILVPWEKMTQSRTTFSVSKVLSVNEDEWGSCYFLLSPSIHQGPPEKCLCIYPSIKTYFNECVCVLGRVWLFVTPWTVAQQTPLSGILHGVLQARRLEWGAIPFPNFKEWAHTIMKTKKPKICKVDQQAGDPGQASVAVQVWRPLAGRILGGGRN